MITFLRLRNMTIKHNRGLLKPSDDMIWSPGSYSYESEDYAELADKLDSQVCKETKEKEEEQVCCDRDQIKVALQWSLIYFLI